MSTESVTIEPPKPAAETKGIYGNRSADERVALSVIDSSMKVGGVFFVCCGVAWLLIGSLLGFAASFKLHNPDFLASIPELTFGRVRSAHLNAMTYGWANNAVFAVGLWIMARLCRAPVRHGGLLIIAGAMWNIGVLIGVRGILFGDMTSVEWLEIPTYITPVLALSYALIGVWGILAFHHRKGEHVYVSQWYILGALFWFPWIYTVAQMLIFFAPARGTVQAITNWWFAHNVLGLWYTPVGLGAVYYLIPKILGRPIHSYYLSILGFWSLALFYNWAGVHHLIGGPIPLWLQTAGIVGSIGMVIPVVVVAVNHHMTVTGCFRQVWNSPTLRFIVFGAVSYTAVSLLGSMMAIPEVNVVTHFTHFTVAHAHHGAYAFFTMVMFGSIYFMVPRLIQREWPSATLIRIHFWTCGLGVGIYIVGLSIGGWMQGMMMNNPEIPFLEIVQYMVPWLMSRSVAGILMTIGHCAFAINVAWILLGPKVAEPKVTFAKKATA
ncbi:cbb3-type cytochrome c oxidase subunit I [Puniceicoccus vermicola]|uniref:Cbb3-type cytochrome c oxidase subunit I n=1 Tax=Puniceicoccus vermicola TaxID=388746 RepID=A0A7X1B294_9BACT|nr:cbb3-type cytochrome c oxidase subunit I [Puniceicoccus vermicola]MBC2603090.1 cbb3-type cytochrome c oxidase subunit I [Puniceicoccus vermicola]